MPFRALLFLNGSGLSPEPIKAHHRKDQGKGGDWQKRACRMKFRRKTSCSALRRCCPQTTVRLGPLVARLGPAVMSAIPSLWDGKRTLRKPYLTSSLYECRPLTKGPDGAPVCKFPAPHFEFPGSGNEPRHGDLPVRRVTPAPRRLATRSRSRPGALAVSPISLLRPARI
jgi:hypothetical protein